MNFKNKNKSILGMERYLNKKKLFCYIKMFIYYEDDIMTFNRVTPNEFTCLYMRIIDNSIHRPKIYISGFNDDECKEINDFIYKIYILSKTYRRESW